MDAYQNILQKTYDGRIPFAAHCEITRACNLSCIHCYVNHRRQGRELDAAEWENVLGQLADMGCLFLAFTGGEIFCRKDFMRILRAARRKGFAVRLFTNGTLVTRELADRIAGLEPLGVETSLYAMEAAIHDGITGVKGSHAATLACVEYCLERGLNVSIKTVLLKRNVGEFDAMRKFAKKAGARFVFDFIVVPADNGSNPMGEHGLSEEQIFEFIANNAEAEEVKSAVPAASDPICGAGSNTLCITPLGDVYPCLALRESVGNLREASLRKIWTSAALDRLRNSRYCDLASCKGCAYAGYCSRCAGVAMAECGNILGRSEVACMVARATKRAREALASGRAGRVVRRGRRGRGAQA